MPLQRFEGELLLRDGVGCLHCGNSVEDDNRLFTRGLAVAKVVDDKLARMQTLFGFSDSDNVAISACIILRIG